ncbi:MAG: hypothetical protein ABSD78_15595 [Acidimicrobiales bacterium]
MTKERFRRFRRLCQTRRNCTTGPGRWCWRSDDPMGVLFTNPSPEDAISAGDVLVSVGTAEQLGALAEVATPG